MDDQTMVPYSSKGDTLEHIRRVNHLLIDTSMEFLRRAQTHDESKLHGVEKDTFDKFTPLLKTTKYDSDEYKKHLEDMKPALAHHYGNNTHHPEHYASGINDMSLFDIMELLLDWKAASERQLDGNIRLSIEKNSKRFNIDNQLKTILNNTVDVLRW